MVNLFPKDRKYCEEMDDDSVMLTNWLECMGELHPSIDVSFGQGTWKHYALGDIETQYGHFYTGVTGSIQNVHAQHAQEYNLETRR